ncbi:hypothetical protein ACFQ48_17265 [Hymenobacter caeli]|uniref:hypothetical protein n=1 Tax=Hymenobacter caeli TaxID=2735894 RepID=UPI0015708AAF|nr:hypothetical protein [Hymenobacter caeli]
MFEIIAFALFQIFSITSNPSVTNNGGSGGWGNDITGPAKTNAVQGGSGGWGNDITAHSTTAAQGGSGGWGND